jgi:hypothetical protein
VAHGHAGAARARPRPVQRARPTAARETAEETGRLTGAGTAARHDGRAARLPGRHGDGLGDGGFGSQWSGHALSWRRREGRGMRAGGARLSGWAADAARPGAYLSSRARVRTAPPAAANHGSARHDTATDRRAPRVSQISNLNKSPWMKIAQRK